MAEFDISIDRVKKIPVPLLVIGLGGTGCDALKAVKKTFAERYELPVNADGQEQVAPPKTAYLAFDSLNERPDGLEINEYVDISVPGMDKILANQDVLLQPYERTWVNRDLRHASNGLGMGTVRQAARLALCRNYDKIATALKGALNSIVSVTAGAPGSPVNRIEVVLMTGIGGGTGSGTFLDMAQIVRHIAKQVSTLAVQITGYIVMPDVSLARVSSASGMAEPIKHNAYAALKELDFWMQYKVHEIPYTMQYNATTSITWNNPPFDSCLLMSASNVNGIPYKDGYMAVMNTIAENLMHYMAHEDGVTTQYSYRQYEDNLGAIRITKTRPVFYGYRAIGAFTKRIPKKALLYYEGAQLLKTFIPLRDSKGLLQPDRRMFTDGQGAERAKRITGYGPQLMQDFRTNICHLPDFCSMDLTDKVKVADVQSKNPAPHNRWHKWRDGVCMPTALDASEKYLSEAWNRFADFADSVITDPDQGPFALEAYLDDVSGLMSDLNDTLESWVNKRNNLRQQLGRSEETCEESWPNFCHPPLLGRKAALETYDHALRTLYTNVCDAEFLEHYIPALEKLIIRIGDYLRDGLKPMCATIVKLETEFNSVESSDAVLVQDIYKLEEVQGRIDEVFADVNADNKLTVSFLQSVTDISMITAPCVDAKSSGVTFQCRGVGLERLCAILQQKLTETYGDVNNQSLDSIMVNNVGEDVVKQQQWMDRLANDVLDSAMPMFMQDVVFQHEEKAPYSYMSIPANAPKHLQYIEEAYKTHQPPVEPKASSLSDHIYCLTAWDKLPLYRYGLIEELRKSYENDLHTEGAAKGMHLVCNGDPNASFMSDWSQLPSPKPYFLFGDNGQPEETKQYKEVKNLVARGVACGMLEVATDAPTASVKVHLYYAAGNALKTTATMLQDRDAIAAEKDPATGEVYTKKVIAKKLESYLAESKTVYLAESEVKPANLSNILGLGNEHCDPFDPSIQADIAGLAEAKKNHERLCVVMAEAMIYRRPDMVHALEMQLPAVEEIYKEVTSAVDEDRVWETRMAYVPNVVEMFIYLNDIISLGASGYKYKYKGEKYDIVNAALQKDDVKNVSSDYVATVAFLADATNNNASKATLVKLCDEAKRSFENEIDAEIMTAEDMAEFVEAAEDLANDTADEAESLEHEMLSNPSKADELKHQLELLQEMNKVAGKSLRSFKKIAKGL